MRLAAFVLSAAALLAPHASRADEPRLEPYRLVRSLQLVQDRIAVGDQAALPIQKKLLEMIDARYRSATDEELNDAQNLRALMLYAMSGGNPTTFRGITNRLKLEEHDSRIALGILAYLNGAPKASEKALAPIEPFTEPRETAASLALIKGAVVSIEDPKAALALLDKARLLAPGTLVEEAALRRSVAIAVTIKDAGRLAMAADQYARAYMRSPYASQFADALVNGVIELPDLDLASIDQTTLWMTAEQRKVFYLRIARRAAIEGKVQLSRYAAGKADSQSLPQGAMEDARLLLYTSLTNVATTPRAEIDARLDGIDTDQLSPGDKALYDAVRSIADQIERPPPPEAYASAAAQAEPVVIAAPEPVLPQASPATSVEANAPAAAPNVGTGSEDLGVPPTAENVASGAAADEPASVRQVLPESAPAQPPAAAAPAAKTSPPAVEKHDSADAKPSALAASAGAAAPTPDPGAKAADDAMASARTKLAEIDKLLAEAKD
jgi:chemotaxis protein MotC